MTSIHAFYSSRPWRTCRAAYIKSRGGLCERCLACGRIAPGEEVHHRIHLTEENLSDPAVALNWDNLELLCKPCHQLEHETKRQRRYIIAADGTVSIPPSSSEAGEEG